jgi:hypothetical protein
MEIKIVGVDFEVQYSPGKAHHGADTMYRLPSTDPEIISPHKSIDTEIPCFTVETVAVDPMLHLVENRRDIQASCSKVKFVSYTPPVICLSGSAR